MQHPTGAEFLTPRQLAELLGVHREVVYRWQKEGNGPAYCRIGPHRIIYARADIDAWLAARRFAHRAEEAVSQQHAA